MSLQGFSLKCSSSQNWIVDVRDDSVTDPGGVRVETDVQYDAEGFTLSWDEWDAFVVQVEQLKQENK